MHDVPEDWMEAADDVYEFDFLTVISYQKLESKLLKNRLSIGLIPFSGFRYVVCDECHYFWADALFNSRTGLLNMNMYFSKATRIYMSATMADGRNYILKKEGIREDAMTECRRYIDIWGKERKVHEILVPTDYAHVQPWFIKNLSEIVDAINCEWEREVPDRWLIWVTNKKEGQEIKKNLKCSSVFITSEPSSEMTAVARKTRESIMKNECFEQKVLISIKVLDCGVNLRDPLLKNIAITATNEAEFIQELGRKRISDTNEVLNLYIMPRSQGFFMSLLKNQLEPKREIMRAFRRYGVEGLLRWMIENDSDFAKQGTILTKPVMRFAINEAAEYEVQKQIDWVYDMMSEFDTKGEDSFLIRQLSWLGLNFTSGKWLQEESRSRYEGELRAWLVTQENLFLGKADWEKARMTLRNFAFQCTGWKMNPEHPSRVPEIKKVQGFLSGYDYEVVKMGVGGWMICRKK